MEFQAERVDDFLAHFNANKSSIRHFPGARHLELHRDAGQPNIFYTYSKWNGESDLEAYRHSDLFKGVWSQTRKWFSGKPMVFSLQEEMIVD